MHLPIASASFGCLLLLIPQSIASPAPAPAPFPSQPLPQSVLADTEVIDESGPIDEQFLRIPTRDESTVLARRLLAQSRTGILTTNFPQNITSPWVPHTVANTPIGLPEYIASCEEPTGNPTMIALTVSTSTRNAFAGSNVSLTISWWDEYVKLTHSEPWSTANLPRASLIGWMQEMTPEEVEAADAVSCFTGVHSDSKWWLPGDSHSAHSGLWMRLVVEQIYWIGGFGDRAFIGWFDPEVWRNVKREDWEAVRLPGEK